MTVPAPAREFTPLLPAAPRRVLGGVAVLLASVLMASCGGGDQVKKFQPTNFVSFGDESSVLASETVAGSAEPLKGLKYTMNSLFIIPGLEKDENGQPLFVPALPEGANVKRDGWLPYPTELDAAAPVVLSNTAVRRTFTRDVEYTVGGGTPVINEDSTVVYEYGYRCFENRLWIQLLAQSRGLGFNSQCVLEGSGAVSYAEAGARVATDVTVGGVLRKSVKTQVAEHRGELNSGTMVTMLAGQNDILQAYADVKAGTLSRDAAIQQMRDRGRELAAIVNDITKTGARVVLATPTDLGTSPFARQDVGSTDALLRGPKLLHDLTESFESGLILTDGIINDGRKIALVSWFDETVNIDVDVREDGGRFYGFINNTTALCSGSTVHSPAGAAVTPATAPFFGGDELRYCTGYNMVSGGNTSTYFWADEVNMSPGAHARLSSRAFEKIDGDNPL